MTVTGQLDKQGADRFAQRVGLSYVIASIAALLAGIAALIAAVRWW